MLWNGNVSIPLWCDCDDLQVELEIARREGFNPTVVRLRRKGQRQRARQAQQFQSHCGAIATMVNSFTHKCTRCFNPTVVRLRRKGQRQRA
ncbi:MAG: hypothetical protein RMK89_14390, partial [Armatimonadota bacterium]|nr:hypothetical protein [Armatimonadota bacterium]MDW8144634.1 hypothetical protein [Armatimonadota bacterium]